MAYNYQRRIHAYLFRAVGLFGAFQVILSATSSKGMAQSSDCMMKTIQASEVFNANDVYQQFKARELDARNLSTLSYGDADHLLIQNGFASASVRFKILLCVNHELQNQDSSPEACLLLPGLCGHGICRFNTSSKEYSCLCNRGYLGLACQEEINECEFRSPCLNGATCENRVNNYTCHCAAGFYGKHCETDRNECASSPCANATCTDIINGYRCECEAGYTGVLCDEDIDECSSSPCQHDGHCANGVDLYACACKPGYTGLRCETDINECASQPCKNLGTCQDRVNAFFCQCFHGFEGATCEEEKLSNKDVNRIVKQVDDTGPTFIRWGRTSCPNTSHLLYHGLTAGAYRYHKGSGSNPLCLPEVPVYARHADKAWGGVLYGAQYNMQGRDQPYPDSFSGRDIPCAVCEAKGKKTIFMLPATNLCPFNWVQEYHGYLMSSLHKHEHSSQFLCFDDAIEEVDLDHDSAGSQFAPVAVASGHGLRTPPYVNARELTCAVCSK